MFGTKNKKLLSIVLIILIMTTILPAGFYGAAAADGPAPFKEDFNSTETGAVPDGWAVDNPADTSLSVQEFPSAENKSLEFVSTDEVNRKTVAKNFPEKFTGKTEISFRLNLDIMALGYVIFRDSAWASAIQFNYTTTANGELVFQAYNGANYENLLQISDPAWRTKWYDVKILADVDSETFNVYINGNLEAENFKFKGVTAKNLSLMQISAFNKSTIRFDDLLIESVDEFTPPEPPASPSPGSSQIPAVSPSPAASAEPGTEFYIDDEDAHLYGRFLFSPAPGGENGKSVSTDLAYKDDAYTGVKSHQYASGKGSYGIWELRNIPAGKYEIYYHNLLIHNNAPDDDAIEIEVKESGNKTTTYTLGDLVSPAWADRWDKIGTGTFDIIPSEGCYLKATNNADAGIVRFDAIRLVLVEELYVPPKAKNVEIDGIYRVGKTLTGSYDYIQDNYFEQKGTTFRWLQSGSKDGAYTPIDGAVSQELVLTEAQNDKYIKFEVTPRSDTDKEFTYSAFSSEPVGPIALIDSPPQAVNVQIEGQAMSFLKLTGTYEYTDINNDPEEGSTYQWERGTGTSFIPINGASGSCFAGQDIRYTMTTEDVGKNIRLAITPRNEEATGQIISYSNEIGPVEQTDTTKKPTASEAYIIGAPAAGSELTAGYVYSHPLNISENNSDIKWYLSNEKNGSYSEAGSGKTYTPTDNDNLKYIKFRVTPASLDGNTGNIVESPALQIKWVLDWQDEFDYTAVDGRDPAITDKWTSANYSDSDPNSQNVSGRWPKNVEVSDGSLKLKQFKEDPPYADPNSGSVPKNWSAGMVTSTKEFGYGYFEARYKYAPATGLNQSFWIMTLPNYGSAADVNNDFYGYELDINEGHYPNRMNTNTHYYHADPSVSTTNSNHVSMVEPFYDARYENLSDEYHTYGFDWNENELIYYMDGKEIRRIPNIRNYTVNGIDVKAKDENGNPLKIADSTIKKAPIWFSVAVIDWWAGQITDDIDGTVMDVDYVRYYKKIEDYTDKTYLADLTEKAEKLLNNAKPGNSLGNYPKSQIDTMTEAVQRANALIESPSATSEELNSMYFEFNDIYQTFIDSVVSQAVVSGNNQVITVPDMYEKELSVTISSQNLNSKIIVPVNKPLPEDLNLTLLCTINGNSEKITIEFSKGTVFNGPAGWNGEMKLPSFAAKASGELLSLGMGENITLSNPARIGIPGMAGKKVKYIYNGASYKADDTIAIDRLSDAEAGVKEESMAIALKDGSGNEITDLAIWTKLYTAITVYEKDAAEPGTSPGFIGGGNADPYFPSAKPSPSPDISPSPSPSGSPEPSGEPSNPPAVTFEDISGHWAEKEIASLAEEGIIKGITETEFIPDKDISRAEFTALAVRALGLPAAEYQNSFQDVSNNDWFAKDVQAALDNGIISKDTNFRPNDTITREEMAKIMVSLLMKAQQTDSLPLADLNQFQDADSISGWAKDYVAQALQAGLMNGMSDTEFAPQGMATRAQSAVILYRFLQML